MSLVNAPFGIVPAYHPSGEIRSIAHTGILLGGTNVNIFKGQVVKLVVGTGAAVNGVTVPTGQVVLAPITATTDDYLGVFAGCEYFDALGKPTESNSWPASQTILTGSMVTAFIWEDPAIVFSAQADAALSPGGGAIAQLDGKQVNVSNFAAGVAAPGPGLSQCTVTGAAVATGAQGQFILRKFDPTVLNQSGADAFPVVQVSMARQHFVANKVSI